MRKRYNPMDYPFTEGNFSILGVRVLEDNKENITKVLKNEWYLFNDWYRINDEGEGLVRNDKKDVIRNLYGKNISISAIAGKNGSGKSTLMGIVYRILNNLSYLMTIGLERNAADPLFFVEDVYAVLYFESDGKVGWVDCQGYDVKFHWGKEEVEFSYGWNNDNVEDGLLEYNRQFVARHFCFTLVANYALFSLTADEFSRDNAKRNPLKAMQRKLHRNENDAEKHTRGEWINSIYNKNDGYQACIGIEPYKGEGNLNLNTQRELALERTTALFIFTGHEPLFDDYCYAELRLTLDEDCAARPLNKDKERKDWNLMPANELEYKFKNDEETISSLILKAYGYDKINWEDKTAVQLAAYIVTKTLTIVQRYDKYARYRWLGKPQDYACSPNTTYRKYLEKWTEQHPHDDALFLSNEEVANEACSVLRQDPSHVTLKLRQALNMMNSITAKYKDDPEWTCTNIDSYERFKETFYPNEVFDDMQRLLEHMPPSIFAQELLLRKKGEDTDPIPLGDLSSGEKQFLQTTSTILYHIRNLISAEEKPGFAKYYNVNLILDELEVCFHPEYQQKFVKLLLGMLQVPSIQKKVNINILLVTHSPFVLSDIPRCNVLCLENGETKEELHETFCANIFDLLSGHFFLDSFVGYFASEFTDGVIKEVNNLCNSSKRTKKLRGTLYKNLRDKVALIGDDIIRMKLVELLDSHLAEDETQEHLRNEKDRLEMELSRIKERLEEYDAH